MEVGTNYSIALKSEAASSHLVCPLQSIIVKAIMYEYWKVQKLGIVNYRTGGGNSKFIHATQRKQTGWRKLLKTTCNIRACLRKGWCCLKAGFASVWNWGLEVFSGKSYFTPIPCNSPLLSAVPATWASRLSCSHKWCFWAEFVAGKTGLNSSQTRWCRFSQQSIHLCWMF